MAAVDLRDPVFVDDPYPVLARLRERDPVHRSANGTWLVTRHADVSSLNRDPRFGRDLRRWRGHDAYRPYMADSPLEECVQRWMFSLDPPAHTRLRRLVAHAFTPSAIARVRTAIEATADELLDPLPDTIDVDIMESFAQPFPVRVIARILGLPITDYDSLHRWSEALALAMGPAVRTQDKHAAVAAAVGMMAHLDDRVAERRGDPGGDVISVLIAAEEEGDRLSHDELIANLVFLFVAGHETTTHLIGNGLLALQRFPAQLARLRREPELLPRAVDELLRFDGPANVNARIAHEPVDIAGQRIEPGDLVFGMLSAANRDPSVFEAPDQLDVARHPNPHLSFGGGPHYCLGAALAKLEAEIALGRILARYSSIEVDEDRIVRRRVVNLRGLERLPLRLAR